LIFTQFFSSMFGMLLSGVLIQRIGYRLTLIVGALLMAVGVALLASGPWLLGILAVCIFGFGYGLTSPAGNLRTAEINPAKSASALNIINAVWGIGAMSSPFFVALAQRAHHPDYFLYGTAAGEAALVLVLLLARFIPDTRVEVASSGAAQFWREPLLPLICTLFFIYVGCETSFGGWIASYARRIDSHAHALATVTPGFYWGAILAGRAIAPIFLRFHSGVVIARAGLTTAILGGLVLFTAHGMKAVVAGAILAGLGLASIFPISVSLLPGWFGNSARRASGPVFASGNVGGAVVPWVMGAMSTYCSSLRLAFSVPLIGAVAMLLFYVTQNGRVARAVTNGPRAAGIQ
jgi:FHS family glucose/mannose:H+ symporter-like MFS transporter